MIYKNGNFAFERSCCFPISLPSGNKFDTYFNPCDTPNPVY